MTFSYSYSARDAKEIQEIRSKYLPREESKLERLKRLDRRAQDAGMLESLTVGMVGFLLFGTGFCMAGGVIGGGIAFAAVIMAISIFPIAIAYPLYRKISKRVKTELTPQILQLADEIDGKKIQINISETKVNQIDNIRSL